MKKAMIGFLLGASLALTGCYSEFHYTNPDEPKTDLRAELEERVQMDGLDNESCYLEDQTLHFTCGIYDDVSVTFKVGFGQKGLLAYAHVSKSSFYEDASLDLFKQDSFEIYVNPSAFRKDLTAQCVQLRLSPLERHESWIGVPSENYPWTKYFLPMNYGTKIEGEINTSKMDKKSATAVGYEFYLPYSSLGLDYNPQGLAILPALVNAEGCISGAYRWDSYQHIAMTEVDRYPFFGNRVYQDQGDNLLDTDFTDVGYEIKDQTTGEAVQKGCYDQYAKIHFENSKTFDVKVEIECVKNLNNDKTPKVGIALKNETNTLAFLLDPRPNKDNYQALVVNQENGTWNWEDAPVVWGGRQSFDAVELEIIRRQDSLYFLQNGILVHKSSTNLLGNEPCGVYLLTMNYYAKFHGITYSLDSESIARKCEGLGLVNIPLSNGGFEIYSKDRFSTKKEHDSFLVTTYSGNHYEWEANVKIGEVLLEDDYPKVGLLEQNEERIHSVMLDPHKDHRNKQISCVSGNVDETNRAWIWFTPFDQSDLDFHSYTKMKIVRDHNRSKYYVNGCLVYEFDNGFGDEVSRVGMITMNHSAEFKDVRFVNLETEGEK